jgi:hypothetical protein
MRTRTNFGSGYPYPLHTLLKISHRNECRKVDKMFRNPRETNMFLCCNEIARISLPRLHISGIHIAAAT